jgi:DNA polymerase III subunit epsilon
MNRLNIIDVETTGLSATANRIIEIGIIQVEDGQVVKRYEQLIDPGFPIPSFITHHTGISSAMVKKAPKFSEVLPVIQPILGTGTFVAHNASFDYAFVQAEYRRHGLSFTAPQLCTVKLSRRLFPSYRHHGLDSIMRRFSINCSNRHRALDDAEVVWQFLKLIDQNIPIETMV